MANKKKATPAAQSAEAAAKAAAAKNPPQKTGTSKGAPSTTPASKPDPKAAPVFEQSEHDLLGEIRAGYTKVAKIENEIADLKGKAKARREALATANRELRFLLAGQRALPFGKAGTPKIEKLDTVDAPKGQKLEGDWFEVREVGSDRHIANYPAGHPHLDDFKKRARDFVVRKLAEAPTIARADATGSGTIALAKTGAPDSGKKASATAASA